MSVKPRKRKTPSEIAAKMIKDTEPRLSRDWMDAMPIGGGRTPLFFVKDGNLVEIDENFFIENKPEPTNQTHERTK